MFANNIQLEHLVKYGNKLVLMDACGSLGGFYLVTLLVRDNFRCWIPVGQFWIDNEQSDLYVIAFRKLQEWTNYSWIPQTFLIDGSNIESRAIAQCFDSAQILRCTRHTTQTLKSKRAHVEDVLYDMESAVFAETVTDCQQQIDESIRNCPYDDLKRYIRTKWNIESSYQWSVLHRMNNPLLCEITTINPCESYHSLIRKYTNQRMSLKECTIQIVDLIQKRYRVAADIQSRDQHFISRVATQSYQELSTWPLPFQLRCGSLSQEYS